MDIRRVVVVGAGTMGHGIAEVCALAGYEVVVVDVSEEILRKALERIRWSLEKLAERGRISRGDVEATLSRIRTSTNLEAAAGSADFVIEAVPEKLDLKREIFSRLDKASPQHTILATNTSTLPITEIAEATNRPDKVIGMHFFNPPALMPLVEIIMGSRTSQQTLEAAIQLTKRIGKEYVIVKKDIPGFIVNRILPGIFTTACLLVHRGEYTIVEVDSAVKYKAGLPMGIFELSDYSGIDVGYLAGLEMGKRDPIFRVRCPLAEELYMKGWYGQKSGRGFYEYKGGPYERPNIPREAGEKVDVIKIFAAAVNMAAQLVREGIATREDVDKAVKLGLGFPRGILEMADDWGIDNIVKALNELYAQFNYEMYKVDPLLTQMVNEGRLGRKTGRGFYDYTTSTVEFKEIILNKEPPLAWIILNRPQRLNALTPTLIEELSRALDQLLMDNDVRVVIIRGAGDRAFSAGADVTTFTAAPSPGRMFMFNRLFQDVISKLEKFPKPIIAAIDGYALGGGLELAMACDFRIATDRSELGQPEIQLGIIPGAGGTQRLVRYVGLGRAKELVMLGDRIRAEEAYRIGLVNKVVPKEKFEEEVRSFAMRLAQGPPIALALAKYAVTFGSQVPTDIGLMLESALFSMTLGTKDAMEGILAFLNRRRPEFKGE